MYDLQELISSGLHYPGSSYTVFKTLFIHPVNRYFFYCIDFADVDFEMVRNRLKVTRDNQLYLEGGSDAFGLSQMPGVFPTWVKVFRKDNPIIRGYYKVCYKQMGDL